MATRAARGAEVLIIGGGIAGASAAYHLAGLGHDVTLLERGEIADAASGLNAGLIDCVGWSDRRDLHDHLTAGSVEIFERVQLDEGEDVEFRRSGSLQAIHTPEQYEFTRARVAEMQAHGQRVELITTREVRTLEPGFSPALLGAMYSPLRAQADPVKGTRAFATLAARGGARVLQGHAVTALAPRAGGGWTARTAQGALDADVLVLAAGAWCTALGALLGLDIPIVPVRGQMWATALHAPAVFQTISAAESAYDWHRDAGTNPPNLTIRDGRRLTRHLYGRQRRNGEIIFGGDRECAGESTTPEPGGIEVNHAHATSVLPFLQDLPIARTWAGLMPFPRDGKPLIGRIATREDLWVVTGLASSGFGRGPMAGKLLADAVHAGAATRILSEADPAGRVRELGSR
jgi:glycine/D-amino acid oxidase-like deaminating enzyme